MVLRRSCHRGLKLSCCSRVKCRYLRQKQAQAIHPLYSTRTGRRHGRTLGFSKRAIVCCGKPRCALGKHFLPLRSSNAWGFKKTIIITHRPVVDDGWYSDSQISSMIEPTYHGSKARSVSVEYLLALTEVCLFCVDARPARFFPCKAALDKNDLLLLQTGAVDRYEAHEAHNALGDA